MPMNHRLLRPTSSTLDADAAVYLNAVAQADGQQLEPAVRKAINDFVVGCKRDGIWDSIKASCILAGARTLAGALVPLKGSAPTNNNFTASDYNRETGLVGNGTDTDLSSNRSNDDDPQNSQHVSVYKSASTTGTFIGAPNTQIGGGAVRSRNATATVVSLNAATGFLGLTRSAAGSFLYRASGTNNTVTLSSTAPAADNIAVFSYGGATAYTDARIAFYSIGESLDLSLLDARVSALITAIGNAI